MFSAEYRASSLSRAADRDAKRAPDMRERFALAPENDGLDIAVNIAKLPELVRPQLDAVLAYSLPWVAAIVAVGWHIGFDAHLTF